MTEAGKVYDFAAEKERREVQPDLTEDEAKLVSVWAEVFRAYNQGDYDKAHSLIPELNSSIFAVTDLKRLDELELMAEQRAHIQQ